jgi:protein TonB
MSSQTVIAKTDAFRAKTVNPETADLKIVDYKVADSKIEGEKITERITAIPIAEVKEEEEKLKTLLPFVRFSPQTARAAQAFATTRREMFSQSFVELSGVDRRRRRWTQMSSLLVQSLIVAFLVILPLWFIDILPAQQLATFLIAPPPPPPPPPPAAPTMKATKVVSEVINGELVAPNKIPKKVKNITEEESPAPMTGVIGGVEGGVPGGSVGGVIGSLLSATPHTANVPIAVPKQRIRVSTGVSEGLLYHRVEPVYPPIAQRARIEGSVELKAIISKEGTIEGLQRMTGHPLLVAAAMDAVRQWRYRPYMLNGEPLEVETTVMVNFHMH